MKKTINKTEELKNNLNRVGDNINKKLINKANNLNEIAQKIESEIQEYTKFANGTLNQEISIKGYSESKIQIVLPIKFNPKYIILTFKSVNIAKFMVEDGVANRIQFTIFTENGTLSDLEVSFETIEIGKYTLSIATENSGAKAIITDWVALG